MKQHILYAAVAAILYGLSEPAAAIDLDALLPVGGGTWEFSWTGFGGAGVGTVTYDGTDMVLRATGGDREFRQEFRRTGEGLNFKREYGREGQDSYDDQVTSGAAVIRDPATVGQQFTWSTTYDGDWEEADDSGSYTGVANGSTSVSAETVTVPADTFANAYRFHSTADWTEDYGWNYIETGTDTVTMWFAEGVGLVKYVHTDDQGTVTMVRTNLPANSAPNRPATVFPGLSATDIPLTTELQASAFDDPDAGDTHQATQWQVAGQSNFSTVLWDFIDTDGNRTGHAVPDDLLSHYTLYYWRVRYQDNHGDWSEWSLVRSFTTEQAMATAVLVDRTDITLDEGRFTTLQVTLDGVPAAPVTVTPGWTGTDPNPPFGLLDRVAFVTSLGEFRAVLFRYEAPLTVTNFLNYVNGPEGASYDGTFIHRSMPGFVIQGGGYHLVDDTRTHITTGDPVVNEFKRSNLRGTIAMAKLGGDPDSATSEWFVNLGNNSGNLDEQNGGFTVFAEVIGDGMAVVDAIAALDRYDLGGAFTDLPLISQDGNYYYVTVSSVTRLPAAPITLDADNWDQGVTIVVQARFDGDTADDDGTLTLSANGLTAGTVTVRQRDDGIAESQPPEITLAPDEITVPAGSAAPNLLVGVTAADDTDGDLSDHVTTEGAIDLNTPGTYTITYRVADAAGNIATATRNYIVIDTVGPVITIVPTSVDVEAGGPVPDLLDGVSASDNTAGDVSNTITVTGAVDPNTIDNYTVTYRASDPYGNQTEKTRTYRVRDTTDPVLVVSPAVVMLPHGSPTPNLRKGVMATDNLDGDLSAQVQILDAVSTTTLGDQVVTYQVRDSSGNWAPQKQRTYRVIDVTPPRITGANGVVTIPPGNTPNLMLGVEASDVVDGSLTDMIQVAGVVGEVFGDYPVTYRVTDNAGNVSATATRLYRVRWPDLQDSDGDGVDDRWEDLFLEGGAAGNDGTGDADGDGYSDRQEYERATDPNSYVLHLEARWALISIARVPIDNDLPALAGRTADDLAAWKWVSDRYRKADALDPLSGTWVRLISGAGQTIPLHDAVFPEDADSDGDGFSDSQEMARQTDPNRYQLAISPGWNIISLARLPEDCSPEAVLGPGAICWEWRDGRFRRATELCPTRGYCYHSSTPPRTVPINPAR